MNAVSIRCAALALAAGLMGLASAQGTLVDTCAYPKPQARALKFGALEGALMGKGSRGVLLSNDSGNGVCEWLGLAKALAGRGFTVLLYTYATDNPQDDRAADLRAALKALQAQGAKAVTLVGASQGANLSLQAASEALPGVVALVALSPEGQVLATAGEETRPFAARLKRPALFLTATDDPYDANLATPDLYRLAKVQDKALIKVPGAAHGTDLLRDPAILGKVLAFIVRKH